MLMAERGGFEPTERFPVHSISNAANSTTLAPLPPEFRISNCSLRKPKAVRLIWSGNSHFAFRNPKWLWRRGWDLNPRWSFPHSGFRDRCTKPLCDLSVNQGKSKKVKGRRSKHPRRALLLRLCFSFYFYPFTFSFWF